MNGYVYIARITAFIVILLEISPYIYANHFTDKWAVHITGGERVAREVADKYGFVYLDQIMPDYYHLQHRKVAKRSIYSSSYHHRDLVKDKNVKWLEQQIVKRRIKRDIHFNDPKWPKMWYLNRGQGVDMNVRLAWSQGYTGKGVVVTILDDGIETDHPDLSRNYDAEASYDVNGHDPDPQPRYDSSNENRHGTRCAGEVAAQADNHFCSVGVAFDARIGGVRMLDGDVTDSVEAQSLSLNPQHIHVYSASWGPDDDGRTVDGPATLARKAFHDGITRGRGGLGSIFVWASGNGGRDRDSCNCDGYTNSIYTLSISSATENGQIPWYSEACSSTLATTYSSGGGGEKQIVTTDLRKGCTDTHTGTSASAPLAAGLCALALQSNPLLTWRDMQHLVVLTAKPSNLQAADWVTNGVSRKVSHSFGYGLMDAAAMVQVAKNWTTVPQQHVCEIRSHGHKKVIPMHGKITVPLYTNGCEGQGNVVRFLEHVEAKVTLTSSRRGEILIFLTSPMGTRSTLLDRRVRDTSREGFNTWAFMTTHSWGEIAKGTWILEIENGASISSVQPAVLKDWSLILYGTEVTPQQPPSTTIATSTPVTTTSTAFIRTPSITTPRGARRSSSTTPTPTTALQKNPVFHPYIWRTYYSYHQWRSSAYARRKFFRPTYKQCIYQTLSIDDKASISLVKHMTSKRSAELKEWTLVVMGTATHPQTQKYSSPIVMPGEPPNTHQLPECAGVSTKGICIECVTGYFMLNNRCVKVCPSGHFGNVVLSSPEDNQSTDHPTNSHWTDENMRPYGVCDPCHTACLTCQGPGNDCCFSCSPGHYFTNEMCVAKSAINLELALILAGLGVCCLLLIVVGVIFMKTHRKCHCCCPQKRHIVDLSKGKYNGISLSSVDFESDSDEGGSEEECRT